MDAFQSIQSSFAALISPTSATSTTTNNDNNIPVAETNQLLALTPSATATTPTTTMSSSSATAAQTAASHAQTNKDLQKSAKETLKALEQDYKQTIREAEKKCDKIRKEADKVFEQEKAIIKSQRDAKEKAAKEELGVVKGEAKDLHVHLVLQEVRNAILDLKTRNLLAAHAAAGSGVGELARANSVSSTLSGHQQQTSTSSSSSATQASAAAAAALKEEAEVKEWVEIAAEKLEMHMSKTQTRQRVLEEVASGALLRQYQAQQDAERKTQDLQRQIEHLQMLQLQHQQSLRRQVSGSGGGDENGGGRGVGEAPPAYVSVGVNENDYSRWSEIKK
ncbi:hypothetical protein BGZ95_004367 [Linnemannia exigua]|uniref:Uncharacterized protein n=1 Tax=Linnemannia exigua TaxID=604196 RepID=A0AAD4D3K4_9FUNG|nr:hypothetical protein BGZ95_004367 [Linnemannia exigua]